MKKLCTAVIIIVLVSFAALAMADDNLFGVTMLKGKAETVPLLKDNYSTSGIIDRYDAGEWCRIISQKDKNYYLVEMQDGKQGYINKNSVDIASISMGMAGKVKNPGEDETLNLREKDSMSSLVIAAYHNNVPCKILSSSGEWYHVIVDGKEGYFRSAFVETVIQPVGNYLATVKISTKGEKTVRFRSGPGEKYQTVGNCENGKIVMILQTGKDWWEISTDGKYGFIPSSDMVTGIAEVTDVEIEDEVKGTGTVIAKKSEQTAVFIAPTTNSKMVEPLSTYQTVSILRQGTEWCEVKTKSDAKGFAKTSLSRLYKLPEVPTMEVDHPTGDYVNLRETPSMSTGKVLKKVKHKETVTVLIPGDDWTKVSYDEYVGYMVTSFLN